MSESEEKPATQNKTEMEELDNSGDEKQQDEKAKLGDKNKKSPVKTPIKEESKKVIKKAAKKENADAKSEENGDGEKKPTIENADAEIKSEKKNKKVDSEDKEDAEDDANAEGSEENDEDDEEEDDDEAPRKKALLDLPLEMSGSRERKKVERLAVGFAPPATKDKPSEEGEGVKLSEIGDFDTNLTKMKAADLKPLHKLLFNRPGSAAEIKKNIRAFKGFPFKAFSSEYDKKKAAAEKCTIPLLKSFCGLLSLEKTGTKEEISQRVVDFLVKPEDNGSNAAPKKKAAAAKPRKASEKPEKSKPRQGARASSRKTKSKSYAEVSNSDEEAEEEEEEEEVEAVVEKKAKLEVSKMEVDSAESDEKESEDKDASDDDWDKNKKKGRSPAKRANAKPQSKKEDGRKQSIEKETPKEKKAPARSKTTSRAKKELVSEESSDDDEPLAKKSKKPPTDDELKALIKKILDGANLEEITMKTVCKQVYGLFPEFDLADRKEFIKETVRSIIS